MGEEAAPRACSSLAGLRALGGSLVRVRARVRVRVRARVRVRVRVRGRVRGRADQVCGVEARVGREVRVLAVGGLEGRACSRVRGRKRVRGRD